MALAFVVQRDYVEEIVFMFGSILVKCANDAARISCCYAIGWDATIDDTPSTNNAVVADGDVREDDAPAADEAVFSYADWAVDDCFGISAGEVTDDACCGIVGDECHVETYGGIVAYGDKIWFGRKDYWRNGAN